MTVKVSRPPALPPMATAAERNFHQAMWNAVTWLLDNHPTLAQPVAQVAPLKSTAFSAPQAQFGSTLLDANGNVITQLTGDMIAAGSIDSTHFVDGAVSASIDQQSITQDHLAVDSVNAQHVQPETLSNDHIVADQSTVSAVAITTDPTSGILQIDMSLSTSGTDSAVGIINNDTANIGDSAGLGVSADLTKITNLPTTVASAIAAGVITDVQTAVPVAAGKGYVLFRDNGGSIYTGPQYDNRMNDGVQAVTNTQVGSGTFIQYGTQNLVLPNPNGQVSIAALLSCGVSWVSGSANGRTRLLISTDGGNTFTTGNNITGGRLAASTDFDAMNNSLALIGVTPTDAIVVQCQCSIAAGTTGVVNLINGNLIAYVRPNTTFGTVGTLSASIPATAAMNCSATYPTTTCQATCNVTCAIATGVSPFTESWAKSAGAGTLTGTTSLTSTVTDTETTSTAGATATTTIACTVGDSQTYSSTAGSQTAGTATITIGAHNIPFGATVNASGFTPANYNGTALMVTGVTATAIKYAVSGSPGAVTVQGTINAVKLTTGNCVVTGTYTRQWSNVSVSISGTVGKGFAIGGSSATANVKPTGYATGGDGVFTWSDSKTAGTYTLSGSTSATPTCTESGAAPGSDTGTLKMTATDGQTPSHSGNSSKTLTFNWAAFP